MSFVKNYLNSNRIMVVIMMFLILTIAFTVLWSIDKGIEPGLSMATGGENLMRGSTIKNKQIKKPFEETIGAGGEDATSMSDFNDNVLKQKGINIKTFKAKRPIG